MPVLYRFMSATAALQTLEGLKLRVGRLASLNDPFDCAPHIVGGSGREKILAEHAASELLRHRTEHVGVICFCRTWREPLLWSHYADAHRGIAIVVRQPESDTLWRIKYSKSRPIVRYSDLFDGAKFDGTTQELVASFLVKSPSWRYEKEVRIISDLGKCETSGGHYFTPLPGPALVGAILGLRCDCAPEYVKRVFQKHGLAKAKVWKVSKSEASFSLDRAEA